MKLTYSIPDKLYYIQNFLDYNTYKKLHYDIFRNKSFNFKPTNNWQSELKYGHKILVDRIFLDANNKSLQKIKTLLESNPFHKVKIKKYVPALYSMRDGAGINWHNDEGWKYGITYYINYRWNELFGGEFLFKDNKSFGFIPLVCNSILILKAPINHKVSPVQKPILSRKTIQIFVDK